MRSIRTSHQHPLVVVMPDHPGRPVTRFRACLARLLVLLRREDPALVRVAAKSDDEPTLFELQLLHLVNAHRLGATSTRDQLLHWMLPARHVPVAVTILDEIARAYGELGGPDEPPTALDAVFKARAAALLARVPPPRLRLVAGSTAGKPTREH